MKIRIAYKKEKEIQAFQSIVELLKPRIKTINYKKTQPEAPYIVAFITLKNG